MLVLSRAQMGRDLCQAQLHERRGDLVEESGEGQEREQADVVRLNDEPGGLGWHEITEIPACSTWLSTVALR